MIRLFVRGFWLVTALSALSLAACQVQHNDTPGKSAVAPKDEIVLGPDSPKHAYIKEKTVELVQKPLMDPVTGRITYDETLTARVSSPISGRVTGAIAPLGKVVRSGDALAELDSPELGQAQSDYASAMADFNLASHHAQRVSELYSDGIASRKEQEQAENSLARARNEAERARLKLVNLGVHSKGMSNRFILHAPVAGIVTERRINPGMEIRPDMADPLFIISDLGKLWVQMDIFEKDIDLIHIGARVALHVSAYPEETFMATVSYISQIVDEASRTVKVRCILANDRARLLPGMFAAVEVQSDPDDMVVVAPLTALFTENESDWVYINTGDYHYQKRIVKVGLRLKGRAVILDGLHPGERMVVDGALLLRTEQDTVEQSGSDSKSHD